MTGANPALKLLPETAGDRSTPGHPPEALVASYRRLADVFHDVLAEQSLDALLERVADTLAELIPHDTLTIYELDPTRNLLVPMLARDEWAESILNSTIGVGEGITGWAAQQREAVLANQAHLDPRVRLVPGTLVDEPEALISVPLIARGSVKGALNLYRLGETATFTPDEFELAQRFGDAAALALDNAQIRARLEHQAQTDSLTGLHNHRHFHERLRAELRTASRAHASVAVLMLDIDDFKRINDVWGHGAGDEVLRTLADTLRATVRSSSDVVCRLGGEEFGVIVTSCEDESAAALAGRLTAAVREQDFEPVGTITISAGMAQGPEHAMNPRELIACAEAAMMTAKARGKDQVVLFGEGEQERPELTYDATRDVRSIAHLKMLQSLSGKLNRLNGVREIGMVIANELRSLIDYHNCRVFVLEGDEVIPVAFRGEFSGAADASPDLLRCKIGEGITGRVARTGESLLVGDAARCEYGRRLPGTDEIEESQVVVPLLYGARVIGVVGISKLGLHQFDEDDVRLLEVLAGQASVALENARLYERERREAETAKALLELSRELASVDGLEPVLERVVERAGSILGALRTSIWLEHAGKLVARAAWSDQPARAEALVGTELPMEPIRPFLVTPDPFVVDPKLAARLGVPEEHPLLVAPLGVDEQSGCISVAFPAGYDVGEREHRLLGGIAYQAKLAIANAGSFAYLEETFLSTVEALANALEANDEYTSSHARSITDTAIEVGVELGLDAAGLKRLELGALFHDIGKIGIPSAILSKPGPLTPNERLLMQTHPELGERIISPIERLEDVRPVVRHCHEHFDGTGYPDRRAGDEIPIESRIILVCDAFHAMTTDRPYRKRLSADEARRRLLAAAGTQFDPAVVEAYLELLARSLADGRAA